MLLYVAKIIDRGRLKEINHRLLLGGETHPGDAWRRWSTASPQSTIDHNIRPGALAAIARDKAEGRRVVMATASYRFYARAIAEKLGFDDCIGTNSILGLDALRPCQDRRGQLLRPGQAAMIEAWLGRAWPDARATSASIPTTPAMRRCSNGPTKRSR